MLSVGQGIAKRAAMARSEIGMLCSLAKASLSTWPENAMHLRQAVEWSHLLRLQRSFMPSMRLGVTIYPNGTVPNG